jgi:alkylation response protein AidB-like acyl-CoA dehydrogenase
LSTIVYNGKATVATSVDLEQEHALREAVGGVARAFGPAYYQDEVDRGGGCAELWRQLGAHGYLGVHLPEEFGGGGLGLRELAIVVEETAMVGCPLVAMLFSPGVGGTILARSASEAQKRRWLPAIASGTERLSFAITEPDAGSNAHRIATRASRRGDAYVLRGQKVFITGLEHADWVMVVARTGDEGADRRGRLSVFVVDASSPGLSRGKIRTVMNLPEGSWQLFLDDVEVPCANRIGGEGDGLAVAFTGMNTERILTSSICTGVGRYALARAVGYVRERRVWDVPIGAHQAIAHPLALAHIHLRAALAVTEQACRSADDGGGGAVVGELANEAKYLGAAAGLEALDAAIAAHGGNGVTYEYRLAPYYFLVRMLNMGPVSKEMILNFIAEHSLALPRSY